MRGRRRTVWRWALATGSGDSFSAASGWTVRPQSKEDLWIPLMIVCSPA